MGLLSVNPSATYIDPAIATEASASAARARMGAQAAAIDLEITRANAPKWDAGSYIGASLIGLGALAAIGGLVYYIAKKA